MRHPLTGIHDPTHPYGFVLDFPVPQHGEAMRYNIAYAICEALSALGNRIYAAISLWERRFGGGCLWIVLGRRPGRRIQSPVIKTCVDNT